MKNKNDSSSNSKKKITAVSGIIILLCTIISIWCWFSYKKHVRLMDNIKIASSNPNGLTPKALVNKIDSSFSKLPEKDKQKILSNPKLLSQRIEQASYNNYKQAFGSLFMLPKSVRKKLIERSAESINTAYTRDKQKVDNFYDSEAGKAALRAASKYFLTELSGRQKAELKPITDAFFKIHKNRKK